jgi:hypothetical protein
METLMVWEVDVGELMWSLVTRNQSQTELFSLNRLNPSKNRFQHHAPHQFTSSAAE